MKNQNLALFVGNPPRRANAQVASTSPLAKKSDTDKKKAKKADEKIAKPGSPALISGTRHLDPSLASLWRQCT